MGTYSVEIHMPYHAYDIEIGQGILFEYEPKYL